MMKESIEGGEALLRRIRRLVLRTNGAANAPGAEIITLLDEFETVRGRLIAQCVGLEAEMRETSARVTAIAAYARVTRGCPS